MKQQKKTEGKTSNGEGVKKVNLVLQGLNGNAFNLLGKFRKQAKKEGWTDEEIKQVRDEATSGDYNHLLATLQKHCGGDRK